MKYKIKSIRKKNKYSNHCIIQFSGNFEKIELHLDIILSNGLKRDMELDIEKIEKLMEEQNLLTAKQKCYRYATMKPRTRKQIKEYIRIKDIDIKYQNQIIDFLNEFNLLDEFKYAISYINSALTRKNVGIAKIKNELYSKGVAGQIADKAIEETYPKEKINEIAMTAAKKKLKLIKNKPLEKQKTALRNHLLYLGFTPDTVRQIIKCFFAN